MQDKIRTLICLLVPLTISLIFMSCESPTETEYCEAHAEYEAVARVAEPAADSVVEEEQYFDIPLSHEVQDYLMECCEARDIPVELALAFIDVESDFRPEVVSSTSDYGLMQLNIGNHDYITEQIGVTDYLAPMDNINAGTYWLSRYYPRYDIEQAAMCYNLGEGGAKKLFKQGIFSTKYSREIMKEYKRYQDVINCNN